MIKPIDKIGPWVYGVQPVPLSAIAGSVGRCADYTRSFLPLKDSDEERWLDVKAALDHARRLPPIKLHRLGEIYFVVDGHHRVSVARERGLTHVEARVYDIATEGTLVWELPSEPAAEGLASGRAVFGRAVFSFRGAWGRLLRKLRPGRGQ
jgi:hypothetical protein